MNEQEIVEIGAKADQVAREYSERQDAYRLQTEAEAALLSAMVERMQPALRALSETLKTPNAELELVCLTDDTFTPSRGEGAHENTRGSYSGSDLGLSTTGTFFEVRYAGYWSQWKGEASTWIAEPVELTPYQVADDYDVDVIASTLARRLQKQLDGKGTARTKASLERADKMRALVTLLGK